MAKKESEEKNHYKTTVKALGYVVGVMSLLTLGMWMGQAQTGTQLKEIKASITKLSPALPTPVENAPKVHP